MRKVFILTALVFIFGGAIFLYFNREKDAAIEAHGQPIGKTDSLAPNARSEADRKLIADPHKPDSSSKQDINMPPQPDIEYGIPQLPTDSVHIKLIEEPDMASESDLAELESDPVNDDVPDSYPIEDADFYFVPPEQRYPGNLGGPPPLNLPEP